MAQPFAEPCNRGVIVAEPCPRELGREVSARRKALVLTACVLASSMAFIDGSVLTVALPRLREDFGTDLASVQWVLNGYVLALASLTLIGGALADVYGKSRMLALGCVFFGLASIACALSPSAAWLIGARVVQGVAAAVVVPASLALIGATYPREERNQAIGVWAAASALTMAVGPILGGWLTETFGWPAVFWINPPLALAAVWLLITFAPSDRLEPRQFDVVGALVLAGALGAIAWALSQIGPSDPQSGASLSAMLAIAGIGIAGLFIYAFWERISEHPMTPPRLARNRSFFGLNLATLLVYGGLAIMFFLVPFEIVDRRALSSFEAGLAFLPFTLSVGILSRVFGSLADRIGPRSMLIAGPLGAALSYVWLAFGQSASMIAGIIAPITLLGISFAVIAAPITAAVMSSVDDEDEGLASGVNNAASRVAQLAGVALASGIGSLAAGYEAGLIIAAVAAVGGAVVVAATVPAGVVQASSGPPA